MNARLLQDAIMPQVNYSRLPKPQKMYQKTKKEKKICSFKIQSDFRYRPGYYVYVLKVFTRDNSSNFANYVGYTHQNPFTRRAQHYQSTGNVFLQQCYSLGLKIDLVDYTWYATELEAQAREAELILKMRKRLLNIKIESLAAPCKEFNNDNYENAKQNFERLPVA
jgi:hypothetical protein